MIDISIMDKKDIFLKNHHIKNKKNGIILCEQKKIIVFPFLVHSKSLSVL